jgi:hypothetical protein
LLSTHNRKYKRRVRVRNALFAPALPYNLSCVRHCYCHVTYGEGAGDDRLAGLLLQLTQAVKHEPYHDSALARTLLCRGGDHELNSVDP